MKSWDINLLQQIRDIIISLRNLQCYESVMYIAIRFPLATYEQSFSAYKVMSFPVPINDSENQASQLLNLQDYLLVSKDKQFYTTLSDKTMAQCQKTEKLIRNSLLSKT